MTTSSLKIEESGSDNNILDVKGLTFRWIGVLDCTSDCELDFIFVCLVYFNPNETF